ncbi:HAD family hydrolase [Dolosicoccus paucivorans]|uniref:HAD family hydrolase n=1 Tax=Dolosicoccus paucivorans TaxID=84521 RepID=UPI00088AC5D2|nr:HAD family hydrolase [Dolosicoccus paucivorans]SDI82029.1 haloacid dehalogenase-like hydrolase [Dolosicoccus paucivorans]
MSLKLVAIDMDETLLREDKTFDHELFHKVYQRLVDEGVLVCIASGNSYHKLEDYLEKFPHDDMYLAGDNGNYIVKGNTNVETLGMDYETWREVTDYVDQFDGYYIKVSLGNMTYYRGTNNPIHETIHVFEREYERLDNFDGVPKDQKAVKVAVKSTHSLDDTKKMAQDIVNRFSGVESVTSGNGWMDVYHKDGGKGQAVRYLQEKYNISPNETIAFGDSLNDASMMKQATYSMAMENADPELLQFTNYQIGHNNDQSVLKVLDEYLNEGNLDYFEKYRI